jgi:hypothetical protein
MSSHVSCFHLNTIPEVLDHLCCSSTLYVLPVESRTRVHINVLSTEQRRTGVCFCNDKFMFYAGKLTHSLDFFNKLFIQDFWLLLFLKMIN